MSLVNTDDYLHSMGLAEGDPMVGVIFSAYYLGCTVGRKPRIIVSRQIA